MGKPCSAMNGVSDFESQRSRLESLTGSVCGDLSTTTERSARCSTRPVAAALLPPQRHRETAEQQQQGTTTSSKRVDKIRFIEQNVPEISEHFDVLFKIGEGTFSSVYAAALKGRPESMVALKHLIPTSSSVRIENEVKCLQMMGGKDNVITLNTCVRHDDHVVLVMPYFPHDRFQDYLPHVTVQEVQEYMKALFLALKNVHSHHIIHRDIKPSNFLYNRERREFQLVDFGLAHLVPAMASSLSHQLPQKVSRSARLHPPLTYQRRVHQRSLSRKPEPSSTMESTEQKRRAGESSCGGGSKKEALTRDDLCPLRHSREEVCDCCMKRCQQIAPRAGTPGFRAPEVLLKYPNQTTAVDIWSAGVILLSLLSGCYPFFRAHDDRSAMAQVMALMGSNECAAAAREYGKDLVCVPELRPVDLKHLCQSLHSSLRRSSVTASFKSPSKKTKLSNGQSVTPDTGVQRCSTPVRTSGRLKKPILNIKRSTPSRSPKQRGRERGKTSTSEEIADNEPMDVPSCTDSWDNVPESAYALLRSCLELNPAARITAEQALSHPFLVNR